MEKTQKKVAILTSGGDAPGMNAAIRGIVLKAILLKFKPYFVLEGYKGLCQDNIIEYDESVHNLNNYMSQGGSFIFTARYPQFRDYDIRQNAVNNLKKLGIEHLIVIGGDGSYRGANLLHKAGIKTITLPGTIDNDIASSDYTIGYDTALNTIVEAVDRIRDTARSTRRCIFVEVMGHGAGDLALYSSVATGAEIIITNESKKTPRQIAHDVKKLFLNPHKRSVVVIVSEFIFDDLSKVASRVEEVTGISCRSTVLGHIQRGGKASARERIDAVRMGSKAMTFLNEGKSGLAVGIQKNETIGTPLEEALSIPHERAETLKQRNKKYTLLNQAMK